TLCPSQDALVERKPSTPDLRRRWTCTPPAGFLMPSEVKRARCTGAMLLPGDPQGWRLRDQFECGSIREGHPKSRCVRELQPALLRHLLTLEEIAEDGSDRLAIGARGDIFAEGRPGLAGDEVIGIGSAAMRNDGNVIGR